MQNTVEHVEETSPESQGLIRTPRQLIITVILAFVIPITTILLLVKLVQVSFVTGASPQSQSPEAIARRIQPVASFALVEASAEGEAMTGQQVYDTTCAACHSAGVAGAPKTGDNAAWAPLIESGFGTMVKIAIEGINAMPPRGGNPSLSDLEVARAVAYMANESGGSFEEPSDEDAIAAATSGEAAPTPDTSTNETDDSTSTEAQAAAESPAQAESDTTEEEPTATNDAAAASEETTAETSQEETPEAAAPESTEQQTTEDAAASEDEQGSDSADQAAAGELDPAGEKLYNAVCFACHTTGVANAPKLGSKEDWAPYLDTGFDTMLEKSISGVGAMPPRGGSQASDDEMKAALEYIISTLQ